MPSQFKNIEIQDTGFLTLPSGTSAERPASPASGMIRYNTDLGITEWYDSDDSAWKSLSDTFPRATGGTMVDTEINGRPYRLHYFTETGTDTLSVTAGGEVEYLIVAGGGSGGTTYADGGYNDGGGGGGAGGFLAGFAGVATGNYSIIVGNGGQPGNNDNRGTNGENSSAFGLTAIGGGAGGSSSFEDTSTGEKYTGANGGSGGGGSGGWTYPDGDKPAGGSGVLGQGNSGGTGGGQNDSATQQRAGGGGGAGSPGQDAGFNSGNGGSGILSSITGENKFYAGGGGGGNARRPGGRGLGGIGGGGAGGGSFGDADSTIEKDGYPGQRNTGGGGGGGASGNDAGDLDEQLGGAGGSGIVIIRYPRDPDASYSAPDRTISSTLPGNFNIIQDGLILNLDAGNPVSYPGSGSTWRDLGPYKFNGAIQNSVEFSSENEGMFVFNGNDHYIDLGNQAVLKEFPLTIEAVFLAKQLNEQVIYSAGTISANPGIELGIDNGPLYINAMNSSGGEFNQETNIEIDTFQFYHVVGYWSGNTGDDLFLYVNGELAAQNAANDSGLDASTNVFIGASSHASTSGSQFFKGNIGLIRSYNRILSEQEIRHNFNVTRGRFGV